MELKWTILGLALYTAMGLYAAAAILFLARLRRAAWAMYGAGCAVAAAGWAWRWIEAGHVPLQNLFEVCLTMGALMFPLTLFGRRFLNVGTEAGDAVIGLLVLFPVGFVFSGEPKMLMPALQSVLFVPHVAAYMFAYVVMGKAAVQALGAYAVKTRLAMLVYVLPRLGLMVYVFKAGQHPGAPGLAETVSASAENAWLPIGWLLLPVTLVLRDVGMRFFEMDGLWYLGPGPVADLALWGGIAMLMWRARPLPMERRLRAERDMHVVVRLGFPLLTLGLVLGAVWGKLAWGDYWNWDPKELWSLASWLVFLGYLHFRYLYGKRYLRANASLVLAGVAAIVLTLLWVNLGRLFGGGLHTYAT